MSNPHYTPTANPATRSRGRSVIIRNEYELVEDGFDSVEAELQARVTVVDPTSSGTMVHVGDVDFRGAAPTLVPTVTPAGDSSNKAASTEFVQNAIGALPGVIPAQAGHEGAMLAVNPAGSIYWQDGALSSVSFSLLAQGVI